MAITTEPQLSKGTLPKDFEQIFRDHYAFVRRTAQRVLGSSEEADDVLQTLFLRLLLRDLPRGLKANPKAFLYRATVNLALDVLRSRRRRDFEPFADEHIGASAHEPPLRGQDEVAEHLRAALADLRPKAVEILMLRHVHGYSDAEIAKFLGTTRGTVAVSLFRTRARLRKRIKPFLERKR